MSGDGRLLRIGEAAEMLGIDARQVYEAIDTGDLSARHVEGHGIRLVRVDIEAYVAAREPESGASGDLPLWEY
jgi:excisionase family DNA binding protein